MSKFGKKTVASALAMSMFAASLGGLPLSDKGWAEKLGLNRVANAAESGLPTSAFLERMNELYAALAAGDPADVQDVRELRDEIAGLDETADQILIDPIWNKISDNLPETVDQAQLKTSLFRLVKAVGSFRYDPQASDLEAIRANPEFRATLKTIAAAGGDASINMDDFLVFLFGDGAGKKGVEGTVAEILSSKSVFELFQLLGDKQGITAVLLLATEKLLTETNNYKFSSILSNLGVTSQDVRATVLGFQVKLKQDEPAINAMTVAYIRSAARSTVVISEDGLKHVYSLNIYGIGVPALALQWSKVSGSADIKVATNGTVTIPEGVESASAVIQAKLINPYGGSAKVIYEKEVTLTAAGEETEFPAEQFLERMNKLHEALLAGDPADVQDVRNARDEIAALDATTGQALLDPLWRKIAPKLPASADKAKLKASLFEVFKAVGSFQYDPQASDLEAIRTNPEYRATLKTIGAAGGVSNLVMDDILVFLFGDGEAIKGVDGMIRERLESMSPAELLQTLGNPQAISALSLQAMQLLIADTEAYKISSMIATFGIGAQDLGATILGLSLRLQKDEPALYAMTIALIRSESTASAEVSEDGLKHVYALKSFGIDVPSAAISWVKASGSPDVVVLPNGTVTIPEFVPSATAVIQAKLTKPSGGPAKVIFEQEVTLIATETPGEVFPAEPYFERINKLHGALQAGDPRDAQAVRNARNEIAQLNVEKNLSLIDPLWNRIAPNLPKTADQAQLKASLLKVIIAISSFQYDPQASDLEAMRTNPEFRTALKQIATAGKVKALTVDDILIFLHGDGEERGGVEGTMLDVLKKMKSKEFADLLGNEDKMDDIMDNAVSRTLSNEDYVLSKALRNLGVRSSDLSSMDSKFEIKLRYDEQANEALTVAFIRSEAVPTVKITANGNTHQYGLKVLGIDLPSSVLKWKKVSGSKDVKVDSNGKVSIPSKVWSGTAVIQAVLDDSRDISGKVVFKQEVTIGTEAGEVQDILKALDDRMDVIQDKLDDSRSIVQKARLIGEVVQAGDDAISQIGKADVPKAVKDKAIKDVESEVNRMIGIIIRDMLRF
ncbi:hypothetical protein [Cohnella lupini]|uniref:Ig-like protein group 2 n=1 Tax=Cohnella lupini TaxID=1294267 RepID=A0A3D9HZ91_9BACL|nr:hypothetical protein [Cohnella lupini]RED54842.1 hypothetical protein DFP95_12199 [Cohnella lupini]